MQQPPPVSRSQRTLIASLVIVALVCAGGLVWWRHAQAPGIGEVSAFLSRTVGGDRILFSAVKLDILSQGEATRKIMVTASGRTIEPLYSKVDTTDYLQRTLRLDAAAVTEARRLLSTPGASTQPDFQGAAPFPADPYQAVLLEVSSPAGTALTFNGVVNAHREDGAWKFTLVSGGFEGGGMKGAARSTFGQSSFAIGDVGDDTKLHALVADFESFGNRVAGINRNLESARTAERRKNFLALIEVGQVFGGTAVAAASQTETPLYLEIVERPSENEVRAVLRNENSWHVVRSFQGTWSADDKFEDPVLNLTSLASEAVRNAGPFVEATQAWRFALHVDARGQLTEQNRFFKYRLQPLAPDQVATVRTRLEAEYEQAVAATEPGVLYLGTATSRTSKATEPVLLRFGPRPPGSETAVATIESTVRAWKRTLRGTILSNARRSGGAPIRLQADPKDAVDEAPVGSLLKDPGELNLKLGLDQGALVGSDERFTYRFAVAGAAELQRLEAGRLERRQRIDRVVRTGITYDGIMRENRGYNFRTRLEFTRVDRQSGVIAARVRSLTRLNVYREFLGTWDAGGDSFVLNTTDVGVQDKAFGFNLPFFATRENATLRLTLTGTSLAGTMAGEPNWTIGFPADAYLSAPDEDGALPSLPTKEGAYLLSEGNWVALPANHGHVVTEPAPDISEEEFSAQSLRALKGIGGEKEPVLNSKRKDKDKEMVSYLEFDGKETPPVARGSAVVLLYVGPESSGEPALELASSKTTPDGRRRIKIEGVAPPTARFGHQRVAAYVTPVAPNAILLTTTSPLPAGSYAFNAGAGYELIRK